MKIDFYYSIKFPDYYYKALEELRMLGFQTMSQKEILKPIFFKTNFPEKQDKIEDYCSLPYRESWCFSASPPPCPSVPVWRPRSLCSDGAIDWTLEGVSRRLKSRAFKIVRKGKFEMSVSFQAEFRQLELMGVLKKFFSLQISFKLFKNIYVEVKYDLSPLKMA